MLFREMQGGERRKGEDGFCAERRSQETSEMNYNDVGMKDVVE